MSMEDAVVNEVFYKEKRQFVRYGLKARGEISLDDGAVHNGTIRDVSVAGAFFEAEGLGDEVVNQFVKLSMNVEIKGELCNMLAQCKIVRATDTGVGMLFGKMDDNSKVTFHALMQELRDNLIKDE